MAEHPIQNLMNVTMDKIRQMVDSNTIVGKPITTDDGTTILPVSKVSFRRGCQYPARGIPGGQGRLRPHHPAL